MSHSASISFTTSHTLIPSTSPLDIVTFPVKAVIGRAVIAALRLDTVTLARNAVVGIAVTAAFLLPTVTLEKNAVVGLAVIAK